MRRLVVGLAMAAAAIIAPAWALAGDQEIADEIVRQLRDKKAAGELTGFGIDLEIDQGTVWLKGHVNSSDQLDMVLAIARDVDGVEEVVDDLTIKAAEASTKESSAPNLLKSSKTLLTALRAPKKQAVEPIIPASAPIDDESISADQQIAQTIVSKLRDQQSQGNLKGFSIDVSVDAGSVWLKGSVSNSDQHMLVLDIARRVRGVTQVVNDIRVARQPVVTRPVSNQTPIQPNNLQPTTVNNAQPVPQSQAPVAYAPSYAGQPVPTYGPGAVSRARYDHPSMPNYAWPSYASYPNYGAVTYPRQHSASAWPYIGPFYPYPQVPLGWRKVKLEWKDGWWFLDFKSK